MIPTTEGKVRMKNYHVSMDSFGSECPGNWEEIADYLNAVIDLALEQDPDYFEPGYDDSGLSAEGHDVVNNIWERFCAGEFPDAPVPVWDE